MKNRKLKNGYISIDKDRMHLESMVKTHLVEEWSWFGELSLKNQILIFGRKFAVRDLKISGLP